MDQIRADGQIGAEGTDESNDEIQRYESNEYFLYVGSNMTSSHFRYMHGRGCSKRYTVGSTDEMLSSAITNDNTSEQSLSHSPAPSTSGRTRRTGLLTVMERPPGKQLIYTFIRM